MPPCYKARQGTGPTPLTAKVLLQRIRRWQVGVLQDSARDGIDGTRCNGLTTELTGGDAAVLQDSAWDWIYKDSERDWIYTLTTKVLLQRICRGWVGVTYCGQKAAAVPRRAGKGQAEHCLSPIPVTQL